MPSRVDHVSDVNGEELSRYWKLYDIPDFVKRADMVTTFNPGELAVTVYADPVRKQFPCHNAASTWLSALYFTEKRAEFHPKDQVRIQQRLEHYTNYWKIGSAVQKMLTKHAEYAQEVESSLPDSTYAFVEADPTTGQKVRHLPLRNAIEVKSAAEYVHTYVDRFTYAQRNRMANRILEKSARYGAGLGKFHEFLEKQAGRGVCDPDRVVQMLKDRAKLATLPALKEQLTKLACTVANQPRQALNPEMLVKLAETVDTVDRGMNLYGKYTEKIPRPEDILFEATFTKAASDLSEKVALTSGNVYKKADFAKVSLDDIRSLLGNDFADEVKTGIDGVDPEKLAELAATLPRPDAELFDKLMEDCNLHPQLHKAASVKHGFTPADFARLADAYLS